MKKIILIFLLVIVLAFGGLTWYVSYQMDWNAHKDKLADELSAIIGKKIVFSGDLDVSLIPSPQMSAKDIEIVNQQTSEKLAVIKQMETSVSLRSLLKGTPDIRSLSLSGVEVWFKFDKNNVSNWHQSAGDDSVKETKKAIKDVSFQSFSLKNSLVHVSSERYNTSFDLTNVNTDVQASSLRGPYRLDGNFMKDNDKYGLAFSIDSISQLEDIGLRFAITHPNSDSYIRYDGIFNFGSESFKGEVSGSSNHAADFINIIFNRKLLDDKFNQPLIFSTTLSSDEKAMNFSRLVIKFNEYIEGAGDVKILKVTDADKKDEIEVKYQLVSLDLIPLVEAVKNKFTEFRAGTAYIPTTNFNIKYDLTAERVKISSELGGIFENVSAKGAWNDNILSLEEFYAAGAGNVVLTMSGSVEEKDKKPHYFASVSVEGQNFLSWINSFGVKLTAPVQSVYRDGTLNFDLDGDPDNLKLNDIRLSLDKADVSGEVAVGLEADDYSVKMTANKLNLDNYIAPVDKEDVKDFSGILQNNLSQLAGLKDLKLNIEAHLKNTAFRTIPMSSLDLNAKLSGDGALQLTDLTAKGMMNSELSLNGIVKDVSAPSLLFDKFNYRVRSQNFQSLADKWKLKLPPWQLFKQRNFEIKGTMNGTLQSFNTETTVSVDDSSLIYKGSLNKAEDSLNFDGTLLMKTTRLENILKNLGIVTAQSANTLRGAFNAEAKITGSPMSCQINDLDIQHGVSHYTGNLNVRKENNITGLQGKINTNELNLANWIKVQNSKSMGVKSADNDTFIKRPVLDGDTFGYNGYKDVNMDIELIAEKVIYKNNLFTQLHARILNEKSLMRLQELSLKDNDVNIRGNLEIDYKQTPKMRGSLDFSNIKVDNLGGSIYGLTASDININASFETSAVSVAEMFEDVSGTLNYSGGNIKVRGINLPKIAEDLKDRKYSKGLYQVVRDNLQAGETSFGAFDGVVEMNSGVLNIQPVQLRNEQMVLEGDGSLSLKDWKSDLLFKVRYEDLADIPEYSFSLSGSFNRSNLDIHIEDIAQKYDDYWKQVAEDEEALKNEETRAMNEKMEQAQKGVGELSAQNDALQEEIEKKMSGIFISENGELYKKKLERSQEIAQEVISMQSVARQTEFTDEEIEKINKQVATLKTEVESLSSESDALYEDDIRKKHDELLKTAKEEKEDSQKQFDEYEQLKEGYEKRLSEINSADKIAENSDFMTLHDSVQQDLQKLQEDYDAFMLQNSEVNSAEDMEDRYERLTALVKSEEDISVTYSRLSENIEKAKKQLESILQSEEKAYEKAKKAELEANANNLLFTEVQKNEDEDRDAENQVNSDITSNEKSISETAEEVSEPVKEAVREVKGASGKIVTSYDLNKSQPKEEPVVSGSGILRQADGAVQKATGSIKIK